jgi:hypothetical protein
MARKRVYLASAHAVTSLKNRKSAGGMKNVSRTARNLGGGSRRIRAE